jgi:hypothetical protein
MVHRRPAARRLQATPCCTSRRSPVKRLTRFCVSSASANPASRGRSMVSLGATATPGTRRGAAGAANRSTPRSRASIAGSTTSGRCRCTRMSNAARLTMAGGADNAVNQTRRLNTLRHKLIHWAILISGFCCVPTGTYRSPMTCSACWRKFHSTARSRIPT